MHKKKKYLNYFINLCAMLLFIIVTASYVNHIALFKGDPQIIIKGINYLNKHEIVSKIDYNEVLIVFFVSLIICLIATLFPAYRSSKINPIQIMKND